MPKAAETRLTTSALPQLPSQVSPDGSTLVFTQADTHTGLDVWQLPLDGSTGPSPLVRSPGDQTGGALSADGRWLAYVSAPAGETHVAVHDMARPTLPDRRVVTLRESRPGGHRLAWTTGSWRLIVPQRSGQLSCAVAEEAVPCTPAESRAHDGARDPLRLEVVLDWSRELAAQVPSPQQPVRSVR